VASANTWTAADAREQMAFRNYTCYTEQCSECSAECTVQAAKTASSIVKCTFGTAWMSTSSCGFQSDAGQRIRSMHGARRGEGRIGNPEKVPLAIKVIDCPSDCSLLPSRADIRGVLPSLREQP
jgi:hypothetical protein